MVHLSVSEARVLSEGILAKHGFNEEESRLITDVLVEAHLWGRPNSGLNHLSQIVEAGDRGSVQMVREDGHSALIDGGNNPGFLVASRAILLAMTKAKESGLAVVGAHNSYMGGINGYYVGLAARQGFIGMMSNSGGSWVAPSGGIDPLFGTNPLAVAVPTLDEPIIFDMATAMTNVGRLRRAVRLGESIPLGLSIDSEGEPTTDPHRGMEGAILPFGGHKGSGLSLIVQCLGIMVGGGIVPEGIKDFGYFFLVIDPAIFMPPDEYKARVSELVQRVRAVRPQPGVPSVRVPGERSLLERARRLEGGIDLDDQLYDELLCL